MEEVGVGRANFVIDLEFHWLILSGRSSTCRDRMQRGCRVTVICRPRAGLFRKGLSLSP